MRNAIGSGIEHNNVEVFECKRILGVSTVHLSKDHWRILGSTENYFVEAKTLKRAKS